MSLAGDAGLVVVGASLAGLRAVEAARKAGYAGAITLVGAEPELPYDRPPLSKQVLTPGAVPVDTTFRTEAYLRDELGVRLLLGTAADGLDPESHTLTVGARAVAYDALVIATGVTPRPLPGYETHPRVRTLRTAADSGAIRAAMDRGERILVVGCGFIGSEVASALVEHGRPVTLVELADVPLVRAVGEHSGHYLAELHRRHGVDLRLGCTIDAIDDRPEALTVALSDGSALDIDLIVVGLGAVPATDWLRGSGVALEADGSIAADASLRTSIPGVFAAGDVVTWDNALFGRRMRLEHWTSAAEQGAVAARNAIGGGALETYATVPYFWSDLHGVRIQFVGVPGPDTIAFGDAASHVVLYRDSERLLGALTVARPRLTMKLRAIVAEGGSWTSGRDLVLAAGLMQAELVDR